MSILEESLKSMGESVADFTMEKIPCCGILIEQPKMLQGGKTVAYK